MKQKFTEKQEKRFRSRAMWITAGFLFPLAFIFFTFVFKDTFPILASPIFVKIGMLVAAFLFIKAMIAILYN
jgi:hypothetical protein